MRTLHNGPLCFKFRRRRGMAFIMALTVLIVCSALALAVLTLGEYFGTRTVAGHIDYLGEINLDQYLADAQAYVVRANETRFEAGKRLVRSEKYTAPGAKLTTPQDLLVAHGSPLARDVAFERGGTKYRIVVATYDTDYEPHDVDPALGTPLGAFPASVRNPDPALRQRKRVRMENGRIIGTGDEGQASDDTWITGAALSSRVRPMSGAGTGQNNTRWWSGADAEWNETERPEGNETQFVRPAETGSGRQTGTKKKPSSYDDANRGLSKSIAPDSPPLILVPPLSERKIKDDREEEFASYTVQASLYREKEGGGWALVNRKETSFVQTLSKNGASNWAKVDCASAPVVRPDLTYEQLLMTKESYNRLRTLECEKLAGQERAACIAMRQQRDVDWLDGLLVRNDDGNTVTAMTTPLVGGTIPVCVRRIERGVNAGVKKPEMVNYPQVGGDVEMVIKKGYEAPLAEPTRDPLTGWPVMRCPSVEETVSVCRWETVCTGSGRNKKCEKKLKCKDTIVLHHFQYKFKKSLDARRYEAWNYGACVEVANAASGDAAPPETDPDIELAPIWDDPHTRKCTRPSTLVSLSGTSSIPDRYGPVALGSANGGLYGAIARGAKSKLVELGPDGSLWDESKPENENYGLTSIAAVNGSYWGIATQGVDSKLVRVGAQHIPSGYGPVDIAGHGGKFLCIAVRGYDSVLVPLGVDGKDYFRSNDPVPNGYGLTAVTNAEGNYMGIARAGVDSTLVDLGRDAEEYERDAVPEDYGLTAISGWNGNYLGVAVRNVNSKLVPMTGGAGQIPPGYGLAALNGSSGTFFGVVKKLCDY